LSSAGGTGTRGNFEINSGDFATPQPVPLIIPRNPFLWILGAWNVSMAELSA
jgi:hypothetical protein